MHERLVLVNTRRYKQKVMEHIECFASPEGEKSKKKKRGKWDTKGVGGIVVQGWICCSVF